MLKAIRQIAKANAKTDGNQFSSALHFDGENFVEGQGVIRLFNRIVDELKANESQIARKELGEALHGIQDFYAHSNWIELGNTALNENLGRPGHTIHNVSPESERTCDGSNLTTSSLTSGYYGGEDRVKPNDGKCRHGGPFDSSPGSGGINKDTPDREISPHSSLHLNAVAMAAVATVQFIRDIKDKVTPRQLRLLFGCGPTLSVVITTPGNADLAAVKQQAVELVEARRNTDDAPSKYVLVPVSGSLDNPTLGPVTVTDDPDVFESQINALSRGFDDCLPGLVMSGMLDALDASDDGGDLIVFTDTPQAMDKDSATAEVVSRLAVSKDIKVKLFRLGFCTREISPFFPRTPPPDCNDLFAPYTHVANDSGGQMFTLSTSETSKIAPLAQSMARTNTVSLLAISDTCPGRRKHTWYLWTPP